MLILGNGFSILGDIFFKRKYLPETGTRAWKLLAQTVKIWQDDKQLKPWSYSGTCLATLICGAISPTYNVR